MIRLCPHCSGSEAKLEIEPEEKVSEDTLANHWAGFLSVKSFYEYYRCNCGFLYCRDYPSNEKLSELYGSMKDNEHSGSGELEKKTKKFYGEQFLRYSQSTYFENVLELGADNGRLADFLINNADIKNYYCVEPNKNMHSLLREIPGVVVFETLEEALHLEIKFDAVIAVHVLDHIRDLSETLDLIEHLAKDEAVIYAVVHNEKSFLARIFGRRWPAYCLQHPHLFNRQSLSTIFSKRRFKNIEVEGTVNFFTLGYLLEHLILAVFKRRWLIPEIFDLKLKLGNICVMGRRYDA